MFSIMNRHRRRARLDQLRQEALRALKESEAEVEAVASSSESYERVQARIADQRRLRDERAGSLRWRAQAWLSTAFFSEWSSARRGPRLALAVTVAFILLAATAYWLRTLPDAQKPIAQRAHPSTTKHPITDESARLAGAEPKPEKAPTPRRAGRTARHRPAPDQVNIEEAATGYIPLTYITESAGAESGQVMRIRAPRAMLVSMGMPAGIEPTEGFVLADVVVGDDGLARAIRLVN